MSLVFLMSAVLLDVIILELPILSQSCLTNHLVHEMWHEMFILQRFNPFRHVLFRKLYYKKINFKFFKLVFFFVQDQGGKG